MTVGETPIKVKHNRSRADHQGRNNYLLGVINTIITTNCNINN